MSEKVLYTVTTPCAEESMSVLEGLSETFLAESESLPAQHALSLRLAVAEGCKNALARPAARGRLALATLSFLRPESAGRGVCPAVEILDPGDGIEVGGKKPPYPASHIGREFTLTRVLDQKVVAEVTGPDTIRLRVAERDPGAGGASRDEILEQLGKPGFGLLALCRTWNNVVFEQLPGTGAKLRLDDPCLTEDALLETPQR